MRRCFGPFAFWLASLISLQSIAHDIPDARVDRSIQATLSPGRLRVDYEVSLAELTLVQDLRQLGIDAAGGDRRAWFERYAQVIGPLDAKGLLVVVNGDEIELRVVGFDLTVEGHPRFTFHYEADIPPAGRLAINDTNYASSEGTSRLALRPFDGVEVRGDSLPTDVSAIAIRPVWQLTDAEERRTRRLIVEYAGSAAPTKVAPVATTTSPRPSASASSGLSSLLDRAGDRAWPALLLGALVLGAAHAVQPGHGKTIVAAASIGQGGSHWRGAWLGLATAAVHLASVALIAAVLAATRASRPAEIHRDLARLAGFAIASVGLWRVGRGLAGFGVHDHRPETDGLHRRGWLTIALAGGIVPCWDAVALVLLADGLDRLPLGLALLGAFSLGMAGVLVVVGLLAGRARARFDRPEGGGRWGRRFGLAGSLVLTILGLSMMAG
jgi:ABC-type nickel/cobalt efflux system permease component RcnA